jgi:hypothetical protein
VQRPLPPAGTAASAAAVFGPVVPLYKVAAVLHMGDFGASAASGRKVVAALSPNAVALQEEESARQAQQRWQQRLEVVDAVEVRRRDQPEGRVRQPGALSTAELQQIASDQAELATMITAFA